MHGIVDLHVVSLFSWRALTVNAFSARTLLCPSPAGIKLALLSHLLWRDGPESADDHLSWLAPLGVAWRPPRLIAVTPETVRIYKGAGATPTLDASVGMREYLHQTDSFGLALLDVPDGRCDDLSYAVGQLRALGVAESLVQPLGPVTWVSTLEAGYCVLTREDRRGEGVAVVLDDLGREPSFTRLSVYRPAESRFVPRLGEDRRRLLVTLPLKRRGSLIRGAAYEATS